MSMRSVADQAGQAHREASPWIEGLGRFGYAAKGTVYCIVGMLAGQAAIGSGGATTGTQGAFQWIVQAPFGRILLVVTAIGFLGYAVWRFAQAILDTEGKGTDAQGVATRAAYAAIGVVHIGLAYAALQLAAPSFVPIIGGRGGQGGGSSTQDWTAWLFSQLFGQWLVGIAGAIVLVIGLFQLYQAFSAKFREKLQLSEMTATEERGATIAGRLGYTARGLAFGIIGGALLVAAIQAQPQEARGLGGALATLARQPFGPWLLGGAALGLIAYGVFMLVQARYRRMVIT